MCLRGSRSSCHHIPDASIELGVAESIDRITKTGLESHHVMLMVICSDVTI